MQSERTDIENAVFNALGRHFVALRFTKQLPDGRPYSDEATTEEHSVSGFVALVGQHWFLITAGHILSDIKKARDQGCKIENFRLDDAYRPDATFKHADAIPPFDFDRAPKHYIDNRQDGDYAAIWIGQVYQDLLATNKVSPLSRRDMDLVNSTVKPRGHWLVGLPTELMSQDDNGATIRHRSSLVVIQAEAIQFEDLPAAIVAEIDSEPTARSDFFARIPPADQLQSGAGSGLTDIAGLSGCPIFSWHRQLDKVCNYRAVAVQSSWWPSERIIRGCPIIRYVDALDKTIQTAEAKLKECNARQP